MKKVIKNLQVFLLTMLAFVFAIAVAACGEKQTRGEVLFAEEGTLVISVVEAEEGATLKDLMQRMQEQEKMSFTEDGTGLIVTINGYSKSGEYWFLYTSYTEHTNSLWGTTIYEGQEYASAILGYESLPVVEGEIYIWKSAAW